MTEYIMFTDDWWNWFLHTYSFMLGLLWAILKAIAVLDPSNKTNAILDSFRSRMGGKELERRASDQPKTNNNPLKLDKQP